MPAEVSVTLLVVLAAAVFAFWRGGPPERLAAGFITALFVTDISYHLLFGPSGFDKVDPVHLVLDGSELAAVMWLALRANRLWPLWAAAAALICYSGHIALFIQPHGMRRAYWAMTQIPPFIQVIALVLGASAHSRRARRWGEYRSWRLA
jgi:hypothetical protein